MPPTMDRDRRKEAAQHFTRYLCATGKISGQKPFLTRDELKSVFSEQYQPQYSVQCLEMKNLVVSLAKAGFLEKPSNDTNVVSFKWDHIQENGFRNGAMPEKPPSRLTKPKQRVIISQRYAEGRENQERPDGVSDEKCEICKINLTNDTAEEHKKDELHNLRLDYRKNKRKFDDANHILAVTLVGEDSHEVQPGLALQMSCRLGISYEINVKFTNMLDVKEINLEKIIALIPHKNIILENIGATMIHPGKTKSVHLKAQFSARGAVLYPLIFKINQPGFNKAKYQLVDIQFLVQSELMDQLGPSQPYTPAMGPILKLQDAPILPGKPADFTPVDLKRTWPHANLQFEIPPILLRFLNCGFKVQENMSPVEVEKLEQVRAILPKGDARNFLNPSNYAQVFELLLFIEEQQMSRDIHYYDMHDATLNKRQDGLWLKIPGLVDKRPSLLINDVVTINFVEDPSIAYEGYVQKINEVYALLGLHDRFVNKYTNQKLQVQFNINRSVLKCMHRALFIISAMGVQPLMFPATESKPIHQPPLRPWFNKNINRNPEQQAAVRNIVHNSSQNSPYLVFGPPGTGKTVTLVETIMQLWDPQGKTTKILVGAPSNAAADEITARLLQVIKTSKPIEPKDANRHIFRMCAMSRTLEMMPLAISTAQITNHDPRTGHAFFPALRVIQSYDIVISTFTTISRLVLAEMKPGHFTHIIMDEVGQALEPEALIPLAGLATTPGAETFCCQVVMAGDPKQLGPIIQSSFAAKFGLDKSMLERLMGLPLYSKRPTTNRYDSNVLTKLVLNYRSHPAILHVSNNLFYDGELKAVGDKNVIEEVCNWSGLPKKGFPLIFHGVEGMDEREGTSPSFFNRQEVEVVTDYIQTILSTKIATNKEIGVVTPYSMQVKKMRKAFSLLKWKDIDVGSVEQFQGQERKVVIISTVRSTFQFLKFDYMFQLGFLRNPKRFNVAVTRARSLLVVVGNPNVLQHDDCWRTLLQHCVDNGAYTGVPFQLEPLQKGPLEPPA